MNSLDIILYLVGAAALFLLFTAGYALGHKDGKREGYTAGRSIARGSGLSTILREIYEDGKVTK